MRCSHLKKWTWQFAAAFILTRCIVSAASSTTKGARNFSTRCDFGKNKNGTSSSCQGWTWSNHFRVGIGPGNLNKTTMTTEITDTSALDLDESMRTDHGIPEYHSNYDGYFLYYDGSKIANEKIPTVSSPRLEFTPFRDCEIEYLIYQSGDPGPGVRYDLVINTYSVDGTNEPQHSTFLGGNKGNEMEMGKWLRRTQKIGPRQLPFQIIFEIRGLQGENGVKVAIDNIELVNCSREDNPTCSYSCQAKDPDSDVKCLDRSKVCDLVKDCPLGDDEMQNCDQVPKSARCDFEEEVPNTNVSLCQGWTSPPSLEYGSYWLRSRGVSGSKLGPLGGDHTYNNNSGHFLTVKYMSGKKFGNKAELFTPLFNAPFYYHRDPNSTYKNSCDARLFYNMYGKNMGQLTVRVQEKTLHGFTKRLEITLKESAVDEWQRMVVIIPHVIRNSFRLSFTAAQGMSPRTKPAIDDFTLSPECFGINVPENERRINPKEPPSWVVFGTCGATGHRGPNTSMCHTWNYRGTSVSAVPATVNVTFGGIQVYQVPASGLYTIFAYGAVGGKGLKNQNESGGKADYVRAIVYLNEKEELYVVVGQRGIDAVNAMGQILNDQWIDRLEKIGRRKQGVSGIDGLRKSSGPEKDGRMVLKEPYGKVKRGLDELKIITNPRTVLGDDESGGGGGGGATYIFKKNGDDLTLILVAAGGGGLSTLPQNESTLTVNPNAKGRETSQRAGIGSSETGRAGGGGSFGEFMHNYTASGRSVSLTEKSGWGGHSCQKPKVHGGNGGYGGGGGGCEGGGGGGGYKGGDGGSGLKDNGQGGYSYIIDEAQLKTVRKGVHEDNGYVLLAIALKGDHCHCEKWCVYIDEEGQTFDCACDIGHNLAKDRITCLAAAPSVGGSTQLSLHHLIVIILCILVSAAVILFFFCLAFNRFRKTQAGVREPCPEGPSNAEVQLSRLRAQAAGAGGGMVTEYNPNYEFGGSTCTLQDLKEIPRENLTLVKALGQGAFGEVYQGYLANVPGESTELTVAVKTLPEAASAQAEQDFFTEAMIMSKFNHPNIVRFIGVCFDKLPRFIVLELLQGGDLKSFLREFRPKPNIPPMLTMADLLRLASDVAKGCQYLEENHFIHRDIAARNCLLTTKSPSGIVKIADFGMARDIYRADYYRKGGKAMLPVKWMPPEAFMDGIFTSKTDIWSFGVLLWEVMSLGYMPYPGRGNQEVMQLVTSGKRLEAPKGCPGPVYHLMSQCWHPVPDERPTFGTILERLGYCTQDPDVISTPLPVFDRPPSMEKDATIMRPSSDSAETCLQSPGSEDYLIPMPSSNYSLGTVLSDLQSGSTSVDSMDRLLGGPSGVRSGLATNNSEGAEGGPAPALPPRAPNIVFSPTESQAEDEDQNSPEGTWETSFSTPNTEQCPKLRADGYAKIPADDNTARASTPLLLTNVGTKASSTLSLDALPAAPPAPSMTPEKTANLMEGVKPNMAEAPLLVTLDDSPSSNTASSIFNGNHNPVNPLQTLDAAALNQNLQNTPNRLSYANVDVNSAKNSAILDITELPFPPSGETSSHVNC